MNRKLSFKFLAISLCCLGIMSMFNIFTDIVRAQDTKEPSVTITADVTTGDAPLAVSFTATVNDPFEGKYPITYDWYFDDGAASTKQNPQHTFTDAGTYNVICRVTFWKSPKVTVEADVEIKISGVQPLAVSVSADPATGNTPLAVKFTSSVTGGSSGDTIVYKWDFGGGATSGEPNPTYTFNTAGAYKVTCTVTGGTPSQTAGDTIDIVVTQSSWPANGVPICTAANDQLTPQITSDGSGGAIITWDDARGGRANWDIYARRISSTGELLWAENGVAICTAANIQENTKITSDGSGGAIITWIDVRYGDKEIDNIYIQRIDNTGKPLWTAEGVPICTAAYNQDSPQIISDGSGGVIITWGDNRIENNYNMYAQRIDNTGKPLWTADGVAICTAVNSQNSPKIATDGSGGAVIIWWDYRSGPADIYAQRIDSTGNPLWTADGVPICTAANEQKYPQIISDGSGGAIITWNDPRSPTRYNDDIYAQRIDSAGKILWTADGTIICSANGEQSYPEITSDGSGGAVIAWSDRRSGNDDIYAQRIDSAGKPIWTLDGAAICTAASDQGYPQIISDGSGGVIITWFDFRSGNWDIYIQRIDNTGKPLWIPDGVAICTAAYEQVYPQIISDGSGGAIITWYDNRNGNLDIYAQRISKDGELK